MKILTMTFGEYRAACPDRIDLLDVSLYDVLKGTALPANTCLHCGGELSNVKEA